MTTDSVSYGVVVPLQNTTNKAGFDPVDDILKTVAFNVKSTLFTYPGENISNLDFGIGIGRVLFLNFEEFQEQIPHWKNKIIGQIHTYCPYLTVTGVNFSIEPDDIDNNSMFVSISYDLDVAIAESYKSSGDIDGDGFTGEDDWDGEGTFRFQISDNLMGDINILTGGTF